MDVYFIFISFLHFAKSFTFNTPSQHCWPNRSHVYIKLMSISDTIQKWKKWKWFCNDIAEGWHTLQRKCKCNAKEMLKYAGSIKTNIKWIDLLLHNSYNKRTNQTLSNAHLSEMVVENCLRVWSLLYEQTFMRWFFFDATNFGECFRSNRMLALKHIRHHFRSERCTVYA